MTSHKENGPYPTELSDKALSTLARCFANTYSTYRLRRLGKATWLDFQEAPTAADRFLAMHRANLVAKALEIQLGRPVHLWARYYDARKRSQRNSQSAADDHRSPRIRKAVQPVVALLVLLTVSLVARPAEARTYLGSVYGYGLYSAMAVQPDRPYFGGKHTNYAHAPAVPSFANQGNWYGNAGTWLNPISGTVGSLNQVAPTPQVVLNPFVNAGNLAKVPSMNTRAY